MVNPSMPSSREQLIEDLNAARAEAFRLRSCLSELVSLGLRVEFTSEDGLQLRTTKEFVRADSALNRAR